MGNRRLQDFKERQRYSVLVFIINRKAARCDTSRKVDSRGTGFTKLHIEHRPPIEPAKSWQKQRFVASPISFLEPENVCSKENVTCKLAKADNFFNSKILPFLINLIYQPRNCRGWVRHVLPAYQPRQMGARSQQKAAFPWTQPQQLHVWTGWEGRCTSRCSRCCVLLDSRQLETFLNYFTCTQYHWYGWGIHVVLLLTSCWVGSCPRIFLPARHSLMPNFWFAILHSYARCQTRSIDM